MRQTYKTKLLFCNLFTLYLPLGLSDVAVSGWRPAGLEGQLGVSISGLEPPAVETHRSKTGSGSAGGNGQQMPFFLWVEDYMKLHVNKQFSEVKIIVE